MKLRASKRQFGNVLRFRKCALHSLDDDSSCFNRASTSYLVCCNLNWNLSTKVPHCILLLHEAI